MELAFYLKGIIFGFSIAAPVGPIGILCIRRSLARGWMAGMFTGLGAASADAFYGFVAGFGLVGFTGWVTDGHAWLPFIGGVFLCYLGLRIFFSRPQGQTLAADRPAMGYLSALFLTLTNPMTILSFAAVFAGMGLGHTGAGAAAATCLVTGVFTGSMAWWLILASASNCLRERLGHWQMAWINRVSGLILIVFGLMVIAG